MTVGLKAAGRLHSIIIVFFIFVHRDRRNHPLLEISSSIRARVSVGNMVCPFLPSSRKCFPLERLFMLLLVVAGFLLLIVANYMIQQSDYDTIRQYLGSREAIYAKSTSEQLGAEERIGAFASLSETTVSGSDLFAGDTTTIVMVTPPRDPPWLEDRPELPSPDLSDEEEEAFNVTHPFLRGYVIESPDVCRALPAVDLLIVVHSAVRNFQRRRILRETWAATNVLFNVAVRRVFVLGRDAAEATAAAANGTQTVGEIQTKVNTEAAVYGDVVQGDFVDAFANLSHKALTALRWVHTRCPQARFVLKADDDVFVDVFALAERFLQQLAGRTRAVLCHAKAAKSSIIVRDNSSRWYVPPSVLPGMTNWPPFCSGYVVVMTADVASELYRASFWTSYVPVDDGFVYGVLPAIASRTRFSPTDKGNDDRHNATVRKDDLSGTSENKLPIDYSRSFLNVTDISHNLTLSLGPMQRQYNDAKGSLTLLAGSGVDDNSIVKLWETVMTRLSPWAQFRSSLARLQNRMAHKIL